MQSSKTSKQNRKNATEVAVGAEPAPAKEKQTSARPSRTSQSKKTVSVDAAPTVVKSHRRAVQPVAEQPVAAVSEPNAKTVAAAAGQSTPAPLAVTIPAVEAPSHEEIAKLAYLYWIDRGCQHGFEQEDWLRAAGELSRAR